MRTDNETQQHVIYDYKLNELSLKDIAKKYNICYNTAKKIITLNNVILKDFRVNLNVEKLVINDYIAGVCNKNLSQKYKLHRGTIQTILIRNNIPLRKQNETARKHQIINEDFFKFINNEEKAYFLGLLYADGSLRYNGFEITLIDSDKEILERFSNIIYNKVVLYYKKSRNYHNNPKYVCKPQYNLVVTSMIMKNDLIKYGCVESKTYKIRLPKLNDKLYRHFIRGYFDGDGSISIRNSLPHIASINITSNILFCTDIQILINKTLNIKMKLNIRYGNVGAVRLDKQQDIIIFLDWMYDKSKIYLNRKYNKYITYKLNRK